MAMTLEDTFRGDDAKLVSCIEALISMNDAGALVPHGIGGHARTLLSAAAVRLQTHLTQPAQAVDVTRETATLVWSWYIESRDKAMLEGGSKDPLVHMQAALTRAFRALAGEQAGWLELAEMERGLYVGAGAHGLADVPASPTPDKETQR